MFIVKFDMTGMVLFAKSVGGVNNESGFSVASNTTNIYITGNFSSPSIIFGTTTLLFPTGGYDPMFIVKYDFNGNTICVSSLPSGGDDVCAVATDEFDNAYIAGDFENLNPFIIGTDTLSLGNYENFFIAKYNCDGTTVSINNINKQETISIFPNPFTSQTTINFADEQMNTSIKITNILGKEIKTINFTGRQLVIDKEEMEAGIYFVQTTDKQKRIINNKIIIQ